MFNEQHAHHPTRVTQSAAQTTSKAEQCVAAHTMGIAGGKKKCVLFWLSLSQDHLDITSCKAQSQLHLRLQLQWHLRMHCIDLLLCKHNSTIASLLLPFL